MRLIQIFSFLSFCLLVYYGSNLSTTVLIYFIPFAVINLVYVVPFLGGFQKNLRRVSYLKIFLVAFVWSGVTTVIPLIVGEYQYEVNIILLFVQRMLPRIQWRVEQPRCYDWSGVPELMQFGS